MSIIAPLILCFPDDISTPPPKKISVFPMVAAEEITQTVSSDALFFELSTSFHAAKQAKQHGYSHKCIFEGTHVVDRISAPACSAVAEHAEAHTSTRLALAHRHTPQGKLGASLSNKFAVRTERHMVATLLGTLQIGN